MRNFTAAKEKKIVKSFLPFNLRELCQKIKCKSFHNAMLVAASKNSSKQVVNYIKKSHAELHVVFKGRKINEIKKNSFCAWLRH